MVLKYKRKREDWTGISNFSTRQILEKDKLIQERTDAYGFQTSSFWGVFVRKNDVFCCLWCSAPINYAQPQDFPGLGYTGAAKTWSSETGCHWSCISEQWDSVFLRNCKLLLWKQTSKETLKIFKASTEVVLQ